MPEGHTVHRLARTLEGLFGGAVLRATSPQGRFRAGAALLDRHELAASEAWGKQLFCGFVPPGTAGSDVPVRWLRVHLGLYGSWQFSGDGTVAAPGVIGAPRRGAADVPRQNGGPAPEGPGQWRPPAPRGAVRLRLVGTHTAADLTGPAVCEVIPESAKRAVEGRLGPDPLRPDADPDRFLATARRSRIAIGQLLMKQEAIAGVGNIYRAEALFRAGLDPMRPAQDVPEGQLKEIWADLAELMADGVCLGRIVTTRPEHRLATVGRDVSPAAAHYVYRRAGRGCRVCGGPVRSADLAGRTLYWCPGCQR